MHSFKEPTFQLRLALEDGENLDEVCNVDGWIDVPGKGSWAATFLTLAEVGRLMSQWESTGENAAGAYFASTDAVILQAPGVESILIAARDLVAQDECDLYLMKSIE